METILYTADGKKKGTVALPESVFGVSFNADLVHQVILAMQANARTKTAHVKDRSEVQGGGRKPWRQKGTGRARHGSNRSPIWRGGGVTHGPSNEKDYSQKINKKMRVKALYCILSKKFADGELLFVDDLALADANTPKTKEVEALLTSLSTVEGFANMLTKKQNSVYIAVHDPSLELMVSARNLPQVILDDIKNMDPLKVAKYKHVIIVRPDKVNEFLEQKSAPAAQKNEVVTA